MNELSSPLGRDVADVGLSDGNDHTGRRAVKRPDENELRPRSRPRCRAGRIPEYSGEAGREEHLPAEPVGQTLPMNGVRTNRAIEKPAKIMPSESPVAPEVARVERQKGADESDPHCGGEDSHEENDVDAPVHAFSGFRYGPARVSPASPPWVGDGRSRQAGLRRLGEQARQLEGVHVDEPLVGQLERRV